MTSNRIVCAIAALSMAFSGLAFAQQDKDVRSGGGRAGVDERAIEGNRQPPVRPDGGRDYGRRMDDRRDHERRDYDRRNDDRRSYERHDYDHRRWGAGPEHNFYRGGRLPDYYRGHEYVVDDWRAHRLQAPPRGYHWVQVGSDYVLVAIATGIIASILLNQ